MHARGRPRGRSIPAPPLLVCAFALALGLGRAQAQTAPASADPAVARASTTPAGGAAPLELAFTVASEDAKTKKMTAGERAALVAEVLQTIARVSGLPASQMTAGITSQTGRGTEVAVRFTSDLAGRHVTRVRDGFANAGADVPINIVVNGKPADARLVLDRYQQLFAVVASATAAAAEPPGAAASAPPLDAAAAAAAAAATTNVAAATVAPALATAGANMPNMPSKKKSVDTVAPAPASSPTSVGAGGGATTTSPPSPPSFLDSPTSVAVVIVIFVLLLLLVAIVGFMVFTKCTAPKKSGAIVYDDSYNPADMVGHQAFANTAHLAHSHRGRLSPRHSPTRHLQMQRQNPLAGQSRLSGVLRCSTRSVLRCCCRSD